MGLAGTLLCSSVPLHTHERSADRGSQIGVHGIQIAFEDPETGRKRRATYLPEVAAEQGWDARETLDSLIKKAGYHGKVTDALLNSIQLERYQSSKEKLTYSEYLALKGKK